MRASFSPQSELRPVLIGLAPPYGLATYCTGHCNTCVAQGIKGSCGFDVILTFLRVKLGSPSRQNNLRRGLRSLPHLREQLKPRADDNHATPVPTSLREDISFEISSSGFQALVRFFVYYRIKPHVPPLVRVPVYS